MNFIFTGLGGFGVGSHNEDNSGMDYMKNGEYDN